MSNGSGSVLSDLELSLLKIRKKITSLHVLNHNIDVLCILKYIEQSDNVWVLAHLKHFNFSLLQLEFVHLHTLLIDNLDCNLDTSLLVSCQSDLSELALAQSLLNIIEVLKRSITYGFLNNFNPFISLRLSNQVVYSGLILREEEFKWIEGNLLSIMINNLSLLTLYVHSSKRMHAFMLFIVLLAIAVELFAQETEPVAFELSLWSLAHHFSLVLCQDVLRLRAEVVKHLLVA